jgi:lantibiotic leader peptide-processing serine protease
MILRKTMGLTTVGVSLLFATSAFAGTYVVSSHGWGKKQERAVAELGGTITFSHKKTGIAFVESDDANFAKNALASRVFHQAFADESVQWQQPDSKFDANVIDPALEGYYGLQWHLPAIDADDAWAADCTGDGARVAVIDGGFYAAHPDLAPNFDVGTSASFVPGLDFDEDAGTFWHGTHVAGIVAAANNSGGVLGVAPEATIVGLKALHAGSGNFSWAIEAILYAADVADVDIINMSFGGSFPKNTPGGGPFLAILNQVMNYAARNGILAITSAGNDGLNWDHSFNFVNVPTEAGNGIAVSATGPIGWAANGNMDFDRPAAYTSHGHSLINVSAPGGDFAYPGNEECLPGLPCWVFDMVLSTCRGADPAGSYCWAAGTSMAAPVAAGVAALIKAKNPGMSVGALKNALAQTAVDAGEPGHDIFHGRGWVNALNACNYVSEVE